MKQPKWYFPLICLCFGISILQGSGTGSWKETLKTLPPSEKEALVSFFQVLLHDSFGGYVLFGEKPLVWDTIYPEEGKVLFSIVNSPQHHYSYTIFEEGFRIWKKIGWHSHYFLLIPYEKYIFGAREFVFINKSAFIKTVQENLPLFQYALGPSITAEKLLQALEDSSHTFSEIFKNDRVLIGIVLGYGVQNALKESRLEYIDDFLMTSKDILPLHSSKLKFFERKISHPGSNKGSFYRNFAGDASFGYKNLSEEKNDLEKGVKLSIEKAKESPRLPWFGYWDSSESNLLLKGYMHIQKNIQNLLESEHFLEDVCEILCIE